ncbi:hypothetical protein FQN60_011299 [Etheostoma spectabile]|uniref:Phosphorylase b kinase regulatory subunit n=1 Tax=Etheostoma spectabile TaxID=54343 RepID=A0A5J5DSB8_9PERO|nr:hypothetical protein FQN60_011299 [Etheostoma spectabile]
MPPQDIYQLSPSDIKQLLLDVLQPQHTGRSWLNRRQIDGSLNRTPLGFHDRVWQILERTPNGFTVAGTYLPQQPTLSDMTMYEMNFSLLVEDTLKKIVLPEYRQIIVELLMVVSIVLERNPELEFSDKVDLDDLDGMEAFYNTPPMGKRGTSSYLTKAVMILLLQGDVKPCKDDPCSEDSARSCKRPFPWTLSLTATASIGHTRWVARVVWGCQSLSVGRKTNRWELATGPADWPNGEEQGGTLGQEQEAAQRSGALEAFTRGQEEWVQTDGKSARRLGEVLEPLTLPERNPSQQEVDREEMDCGTRKEPCPPSRPDRAVGLAHKSVLPWGRTGCLLSYLSPTTQQEGDVPTHYPRRPQDDDRQQQIDQTQPWRPEIGEGFQLQPLDNGALGGGQD